MGCLDNIVAWHVIVMKTTYSPKKFGELGNECI
jgi:hypothetical protein